MDPVTHSFENPGVLPNSKFHVDFPKALLLVVSQITPDTLDSLLLPLIALVTSHLKEPLPTKPRATVLCRSIV
jgi:hypothetical protein